MFENQPRRSVARVSVVQRRGVERVAAILTAAEELLAEQGYAAATLKAIGVRAGIPTASLYHYFADRTQVEDELMRRHIAEVDRRYAAAMDSPEVGTLGAMVDAMIAALLGYFRENPGFVQLWFGGRSSTLSGMAHELDESWADRLWRLSIERELVRSDTPKLAAQLAFEVSDRLFDVAFKRAPMGDDATIDEARKMVLAYLQAYAAPAAKRSQNR